MTSIKTSVKPFVTILAGTFILMLFALYNNFPILAGDTASYILSGFTLKVPEDRTIFYGLFIRGTSLGVSLWLTIFCQCLLLCYSLVKFTGKVVPGATGAHSIALLLGTSLLTICGWFAGQLMPDIFTAILILCSTNFLLFENDRTEKAILFVLILLSALVHSSGLAILILFLILFLARAILRSRLGKDLGKTVSMASICFLAWLSISLSNEIGGNGFTTSRSTHVFVMGKLVESGVLKMYLDENCANKNYNICPYKDSLPPLAWEFHWDGKSPLQKTGGWEANKKEYNAIIGDMFSNPKYWPIIAYKSIEATARQLALFNIDEVYTLPWTVFDESSIVYEMVARYFPHEANQLKPSRINAKALNIPFYNGLFSLVIVLSSMAALLLLKGQYKREYINVIGFIAVFVLLNALITACLSSVNPRFNSRIIWLIPFINIVFLYKLFYHTYIVKQED